MKFCIIGLGTFGTQLARQLSREGHEIVAVDNDPTHVSQLKDEIEYLIQADCTDLNAFHEIPIDACDAVILAIGEDFEASLTIAANIQQLGAKRIISRIINPLHGRLLKLLKIDELMIPEAMAAAGSPGRSRRLTSSTASNSAADTKSCRSGLPKAWSAKPCRRRRSVTAIGLNLITIAKGRGTTSSASTHHPIQKVLGVPEPGRCFEADDILVLFGKAQDIRRMIHELVK